MVVLCLIPRGIVKTEEFACVLGLHASAEGGPLIYSQWNNRTESSTNAHGFLYIAGFSTNTESEDLCSVFLDTKARGASSHRCITDAAWQPMRAD